MKKLLAVILALAMLVSVCSFAANAALPPVQCNTDVVLVDTQNWGQVLMYAWDSEGSSLTGEWPGVQLEQIGQNETGQPTYVMSIPYGTEGIVLNDGNGTQTVYVTDLNYDTYYITEEKDDLDHFYVSHIEYTSETTEPVTGTEPVKEYERKDKIYLTNNFNWQECYLYAWDEDGNAILGEWPGTKVTETYTNEYGEVQFVLNIPENAVGVIANNGDGAQTADITDFVHYDGYWMDGTKNEFGYYIPTGYPQYIPVPTVEPTESVPTQPQPCLYGFYNSQNFDSVYFYAWDNEGNPTFGEWPGTAMYVDRVDEATGWQVYRFYVPAGTAGIIINDGQGRQTEDITTLNLDAYWMPGAKDNEGHYLVEEYTGQQPTTAEVEPSHRALFTNSFAWSPCYMFTWDEMGNPLTGEWPGTKLTKSGHNDYGEEVWVCNIPANAAGMIINNGTGIQTEDITNLDCDGYWLDGTKNDMGYYIVTGYDKYDPPTTDPTETEPTTGKEHGYISTTLTNNLSWEQGYLYAWDEVGNPLCGEWPGTKITETTTNGYGEEVFIFSFPDNAAGIIINNGNGMQTVDITEFRCIGYWMDGTVDSLGHYIVTKIDYDVYETDPPETEPTTKPAYEYLSDIMVVNSLRWKQGYMYAWDEEGNSLCGEWPGTKITETTENGIGEEVFICHVPHNAVGIVISDELGQQTVDITDFAPSLYWMDGTKDDLEHYLVTPVTYDPEESTNPSESQPTTAPAPGSAYYFYNTLDFENVYVYAFDAQDNALCGEWPGTRAEKVGTDPKTGDDKYLINIPAGTKGIVISDGNGHQTEDITDFTVNSYWLDGSKNDLGYYLVSPSPGYIEPTGEPGKYKLGDVNGDDIISVSDATLVQQQAAELINLEGSALAAADTNHDGIVSVADATLIQQYAAEMIDKF